MPIDLPGRELSDRLQALYSEVRAMPPGGEVSVRFGTDEELAGTAGGCHQWETRGGPSWVVIAPNASDEVLAHELLHVAFLRRGYPTTRVKHPVAGAEELAKLIGDAVVHPILWRELRDRGFDDSTHWAEQATQMESAEGEEMPLSQGTQVLANAIVFADALASGGIDARTAVAAAEPHSPETTRLAKRFARILDLDEGVGPSDRSEVVRRLFVAIDEELVAAKFPRFKISSVLAIE